MSGVRECGVCWATYDPAVGDDVWQIPAGTLFEALPDEWRCPKCDSPKEKFVRPEAEAPLEALRRAWEQVAGRMVGLPIVNPRLTIDLIGFRPHEGGSAGIVVTPWFLSVVFVPPAGAKAQPVGSRVTHDFPAGRFEFLTNDLDGFGPVESCSLFSPMEAFPDMASAVKVAHEAIEALFTEAQASPEPEQPVKAEPAAVVQAAPSRRDLFRRAFSR